MNQLSIIQHVSFDISPFLSKKIFNSESIIFKEGYHPKKLYYLIQGRAKVYKVQSNGKVSLMEFLGAPAFIGEMELLQVRKEAISVTAITKCICEEINLERCKKELLNDNLFLNYLCNYLGKKAVSIADKFAIDTSYTLPTRLAKFILLSQINDIYREKHTEVAEYLGVSYRHLLYVIADFNKKGIVLKTAQGYVITDFDKLIKISNNNFD